MKPRDDGCDFETLRDTAVVQSVDRDTAVAQSMDRDTAVVQSMDRDTAVVQSVDRYTAVIQSVDRSTGVVQSALRDTAVVQSALSDTNFIQPVDRLSHSAKYNNKTDINTRKHVGLYTHPLDHPMDPSTKQLGTSCTYDVSDMKLSRADGLERSVSRPVCFTRSIEKIDDDRQISPSSKSSEQYADDFED